MEGLASAGGDTVIFWDVKTRQRIGEPLGGHNDWVNNVAFSPNEETSQNHRTKTRPNRLVAGLWGHDSGDGKEVWQKPCKVLDYQIPQKFLQLILQKVFGLTLEFRWEYVSKRVLLRPKVSGRSFLHK
jgi:WD40 repeat protein